MKRFDVHSFRFRLWAALVRFAVLVCGLMWVVQITTIEDKSWESDVGARMDRIEQVLSILIKNDATIIGMLSTREAVTVTPAVTNEEDTSDEDESVDTSDEV